MWVVPLKVDIDGPLEPAEPFQAELVEASAQQTTDLLRNADVNRNIVRRQKNARSSRFNAFRRDRANAGPSKRSPIRPPSPTIQPSPAGEPAEEVPSRSQIYPPSLPQAPHALKISENPITFTDERLVLQKQEQVLNQTNSAQQTADNPRQSKGTNRRPPSIRSPILPPNSTSSQPTENAKKKAIIKQRRVAKDRLIACLPGLNHPHPKRHKVQSRGSLPSY